jgi:hypothetical protein
MITFIVHLALAIGLFLIQNWIGSKSYSKGYIRFSLLDDKDEALSLNFMIKVFGPIVYLIICVAVFQYLSYCQFVENIINVIYYYLAIRVLVIFLYERATIVNWVRIFFYYCAILIISSIIYKNFINSVDSLLPEFTHIKNEIWVLILLFVYQLGNGFKESIPANQYLETSKAFLPELKKRKRIYILKKYKRFKRKFETTINDITYHDLPFNLLIYSIIIFENFNRPRIIRWIERLWVKISKRRVTQGLMQVNSHNQITDILSIKFGTKSLYEKYLELKEQSAYYRFKNTIKKQCPDKKYIRQVMFIAKSIIDNIDENISYNDFYKEIKNEFDIYD